MLITAGGVMTYEQVLDELQRLVIHAWRCTASRKVPVRRNYTAETLISENRTSYGDTRAEADLKC